jgi:hypothetical protein
MSEHPHELGLPGDLLQAVRNVSVYSRYYAVNRDMMSSVLKDPVSITEPGDLILLVSVVIDERNSQQPWCFFVSRDSVGWSWLGVERFVLDTPFSEALHV